MLIIYTKHALQQMRGRKINKSDIIDTINNPDKKMNDKFVNQIVQKVFGKYLLRIFYLTEGDQKRVLTTYKTSKIDKYI